MIKNIIFDMGNVLVRFDPELFMDRYSLTGEDRKLIRNEVFRSVEWTMLDRGVIDEEIAEQRILSCLPERLHDAASDFLPFYLSRIDRFGTTPETLRLDCPEMQAAMRQYHALEKFSCKQNWWGDSIQKFADGKTAMTVIYSNYAAELINSGNSVVVGRVGAAILPGCKPLLGGGIVGISRYSQKAEACKQFFHWYYSADVASLLVRLGGTSPIVDAYEDFQNYSIFPWMNTSKKSFGLGQRGVKNQIPERFSIPKYEFAVGTAIRNVVQDLMTPEDASRMAQALYDAADPISR